jgi:hypothetical protein
MFLSRLVVSMAIRILSRDTTPNLIELRPVHMVFHTFMDSLSPPRLLSLLYTMALPRVPPMLVPVPTSPLLMALLHLLSLMPLLLLLSPVLFLDSQ